MSLGGLMTFSIDIDIGELADKACGNDRSALIEFVKDLDLKMADWDFTLALCEHFSALKIQWELEQAADAMRKTP